MQNELKEEKCIFAILFVYLTNVEHCPPQVIYMVAEATISWHKQIKKKVKQLIYVFNLFNYF